MIIYRKKFFFKLINVILDDKKAREILEDRQKYDYIFIITRNKFPEEKRLKLLKTKKTVRINFPTKDSDILNSYKNEARLDIRRSRRLDLKIVKNDNNFEEEYNLYEKFEKAQGRKPVKKNIMKRCIFFSAYIKGKLVSSMAFTEHYPVMRNHSTFSKRLWTTNKKEYKQLGWIAKRLVYETSRYCVENDFGCLDLGSINLLKDEVAGINRFKLLFSSDVGEEYFYLYTSKRFELIKNIRNIKKIF